LRLLARLFVLKCPYKTHNPLKRYLNRLDSHVISANEQRYRDACGRISGVLAITKWANDYRVKSFDHHRVTNHSPFDLS